ncbi:MAG: dihydroorotase [Parvularculales bacterium]
MTDDRHANTVVFVNARLIDGVSEQEQSGGMVVQDGHISAMGPDIDAAAVPEASRIIDCGGHILCPGLVDMQVSTGEPGAEHRETLASASQAAARGGVTSFAVMPDTMPVIDDVALVDFLSRRARDTAVVNIYPTAALTKNLDGEHVTEIALLSEAGAIAFTDGPHALKDAQLMRYAMTHAADCDALIIHHPEEPSLSKNGVINEGTLSTRLGLPGIPAEAEIIMLERDIRLVAMTGARYHAGQISCAESVDLIYKAKQDGLPVSCSVSANHLVLNESDIMGYRTFLKLSPPLRREEDRQSLLSGVAEGIIDTIVSGHLPEDAETKRRPFEEAAFGSVGLETLLPAALTLVHGGLIRLPHVLRALSTTPAAHLDLQAGVLAPGRPADIIIVDLNTPVVIETERLQSKSKNAALDGRLLQGDVLLTMVEGRIVFHSDKLNNTGLNHA